jgi:ParB family chromosome partitioning protein
MNAGVAVVARLRQAAEIKTDPQLSGIFAINPETLASIVKSMRETGYDKSRPLVVWKGKNAVVDGHTRLEATIEAGVAEVSVEEKEFISPEDAKLYACRRDRAPSEILAAATQLDQKDLRDGTGRALGIPAKNPSVSPSYGKTRADRRP